MTEEGKGGEFNFKKAVSDAWKKPKQEAPSGAKPESQKIDELVEPEELFQMPEPEPSLKEKVAPIDEQREKVRLEREEMKQKAKELKKEEKQLKKEKVAPIDEQREKVRLEREEMKQKAKELKKEEKQLKKEKSQTVSLARKNWFHAVTTIEKHEEPDEEEIAKQKKKRISALAWISTIGASLGAFLITNRIKESKQPEVTPTVEGPLGGGDTIQDRSANYHQITIGRVGFSGAGYNLDIKNPNVFIDKDFVEMAAKFGGGFLLPPGYNDNGNITGQVSEAVVNDWAKALKVDPTEVRQTYVYWQTHPQEFRQFLLQHGASNTIINFLQNADELKKNDATPETWLDRNTELQQWWQQNSATIGKTEQKKGITSVAKVKWEYEVKIPVARSFNEIAGRVNIEMGGAVNQMLGPMETLANMPIDTTAMHETAAVDMAEFYISAYSKPQQIDKTGLSFVLIGLVLLRVGPAWPREVIAKASQRLEDVYYWFKLGQHERVMRNLTVLGKQAHERVTGEKI